MDRPPFRGPAAHLGRSLRRTLGLRSLRRRDANLSLPRDPEEPAADIGWGILFFILLGAGAVFGVGADALGSLIFKVLPGESAWVRHGKGVIEEGGEGLVIFAMCALSFIAARSIPLRPAPLVGRFQRLWSHSALRPAAPRARSGVT